MTTEPEAPTAVQSRRGALRLRRAVVLLLAVALLAAVVGGVYWYRQRAAQCFARARQALAAGRFDEVERELEAIEGDAAFEPHRHLLRGALLLEKGQYYPALDEFGYSVKHPQLRLDSLTLAGQAAYKAGHLRDAVGLLAQAIQLDPNSLPALRWLASAYYDLGLTDDAVAQLTRVAELDPRDPRPHRLMGLICKDFENYPAAVKNYRESLRRDARQPDNAQILLELADCEIKLREFDSALGTLAGCGPGAERWVREAECQYGLGRVDEARGVLDQALQQEPAHLAGLLLRGTMASDQGQLTAAIDAFSRAAVAQPKDYVARFKLAQAHRRAGNNQEADKQTQAAEEIKRIREEFSKLHEKAAAEPGNADVRCRIGVLARQFGRPDLARVWFKAALAIDPHHVETMRNLAGEPPGGIPAKTPPSAKGGPSFDPQRKAQAEEGGVQPAAAPSVGR
jgi:tetratricopeptide (TPR) repeat protein